MVMRLWWKDARQFWPIWAFLAVTAWAVQAGIGHFADIHERELAMVPIAVAMGLACLYAFAVGAAAFAGEREAGTLRMLDTMPARRRDIWMGKVSFAVVSTVGLAAVLLLVVACVAPLRPDWPWGEPERFGMGALSLLVLHALAWGLFFSSVSSSALLAAVSAIVLTMIFYFARLDNRFRDPLAFSSYELLVPAIATAASWITFTWGRHDDRLLPAWGLPLSMRLRSPIEISWEGRSAPREERRRAAVVGAGVGAIAAHRPPIAAAARPAGRPRPRSRLAELRAMIWETRREGRSTWWLLAAIGLIVPVSLVFSLVVADPSAFVLLSPLTALGAGVSTFGLENRRRTYRFLMHHGARPGLVWASKVFAWTFGLALIWSPWIIGAIVELPRILDRRNEAELSILGSMLSMPTVFAVAVLCGMAIPRGITAAVVALVLTLFLAPAQVGLVVAGMLPIWGMLVLPACLLAVSWAWSGDWLLDRPAPGRWVRLGGMTAAVLAVAFGGYTAWRAWEIEDVGPIAMPSDWLAATAPLPDDLNAAVLYRQAARKLDLPTTFVGGVRALTAAELEGHPEALELIRRASARPECQFFNPTRMTLATRPDVPPMREMAWGVVYFARARLNSGDLAAAWDDLMVAFRMARHMGQSATMIQALTGLAIEREALAAARDWANARAQTPDRLRSARQAYAGLPARVPPSEVVRGEGLLVERTIDLPIDDLHDLLAQISGSGKDVPIWELLRVDATATPWERARARRVNRLLIAEYARLAALEPRQRMVSDATWRAYIPAPPFSLVGWLQPAFWSYLSTEDRTEAERRGLAYVMAVREWLLRHDGRFPDRLEELVPEILPSLPVDPYSGRPFGYTTFARWKALYPTSPWPGPTPPDDARLVYSVGADGVDSHGHPVPSNQPGGGGDIVFLVDPAKGREATK